METYVSKMTINNQTQIKFSSENKALFFMIGLSLREDVEICERNESVFYIQLKDESFELYFNQK